MNLDKEVEQDLRKQTQDLIEQEVIESNTLREEGVDEPEMKHKSGSMDEKVERTAFSDTGANPSPQEIEFLVRQRTSMGNDELSKFLSGEHDAREDFKGWEPFSMTEEKFLLQNCQSKNLEDIAEHLDRDPRQVELQLKIMGLDELLDELK